MQNILQMLGVVIFTLALLFLVDRLVIRKWLNPALDIKHREALFSKVDSEHIGQLAEIILIIESQEFIEDNTMRLFKNISFSFRNYICKNTSWRLRKKIAEYHDLMEFFKSVLETRLSWIFITQNAEQIPVEEMNAREAVMKKKLSFAMAEIDRIIAAEELEIAKSEN